MKAKELLKKLKSGECNGHQVMAKLFELECTEEERKEVKHAVLCSLSGQRN